MNLFDFSGIERIAHPIDAYQKVRSALPTKRKITYVTGPITSGGAVRLRENDPALSIPHVIALNRVFATHLLSLLARLGDNEEETIIFPYNLGTLQMQDKDGKIKEWGEEDYLPFWIMIITGMTPELATQFWHQIGMFFQDKSILSDHDKPRSSRVQHYQRLEKIVKDFMRNCQGTSGYECVDKILALPDSDLSFGSTLERRIAQTLAIPTFDLQVNPKKIALLDQELDADPVYQLLINLGVLPIISEPETLVALRLVLNE